MTPEDRLLAALQADNHRRALLSGAEPTEAQIEAGVAALWEAKDQHYLMPATVRHIWMAMNRRNS
jgi:hypothetical protein